MEPAKASQIADAWLEVAEASTDDQDGVSRAYHTIRKTVARALPDPAAAGVALQDGLPVVVAIDGSRFFVVGADLSSQETPSGFVVSIGLSPTTRFELRPGVLHDRRLGTLGIDRWTITPDVGDQLDLVTRRSSSQRDHENAGVQVMESAARSAGWNLAGP